MLRLSPILLVIGVLLTILSVTMMIPAFVDYHFHNPDWHAFIAASFITFFVGVILYLTNQHKERHMNIKQTFLLTTLSWLSLAFFSALPFVLSDLNISFTDAFFEAMSGMTTTGATVFTGLDTMPPGILLWRSILQWLGGIGIIVMAIAVLPMLKIGGMQLFRTESSDKSDKILPRAKQVAGAISGTYLLITALCILCLWLAGMTEFDALCHALTTVSTGGFSTYDASIGHFDSALIEFVIMTFCVISAIPFVLYVQLLRGKHITPWKDTQVKLFLATIALSIVIISMWLYLTNQYDLLSALRYSSFNIISIITTAGFASADYALWGNFVITFMFMLSVVGGCTGSTTGGIKIFRFQILHETAKAQIGKLLSPHAIFTAQFNNKPVSESIKTSVMSFFILFAFCFLILSVLLSLTGLDYITSMSAAATTLANVGPGLGDTIGPSGNYATLSDTAKWLLSIAMLVGRLELFTVLVIFSPYFWRD